MRAFNFSNDTSACFSGVYHSASDGVSGLFNGTYQTIQNSVSILGSGVSGCYSGVKEGISSCFSADTLIKVAFVAGGIIILGGSEAYFIAAANGCLNDPHEWGSACTTSRDRYGHVSHHGARAGGIGYIIAAIVYPCALAGAAYKKKRR